MDLENIKRGLRAEIKKRENEQYATFQCNVRQMCKDVLEKLEEQESVIAELKADYKEACGRLQTANLIKNEQLSATRHQKYKRCLDKANYWGLVGACTHGLIQLKCMRRELKFRKLAEKFKEVK